MQQTKLFIFGGTSVVKKQNSSFLSSFYHSYGSILAQEFEKVVWMLRPYLSDDINSRQNVTNSNIHIKLIRRAPYKMYRQIWNELSKCDISIIYVTQGFPLLPILLWKKLYQNAPYFVYVGDDFDARPLTRFPNIYIKHFLRKRLIKSCIKHASGVISRGRYLTHKCQKINKLCCQTNPMTLLPHYVQYSEQEIQIKLLKKTLLYVGRLQSGKGIDVLIHALKQLRDADDTAGLGWRIQIIGDGPDRRYLEDLVIKLNLFNCVDFLGYIGNSEFVFDFMKQATLLVVPTTTHPEGFPRVIEEAHALGLPVIASSIPGIVAEFRDSEILRFVTPGDAKCLAEQIRQLTQSYSLYRRIINLIQMGHVPNRTHPATQHIQFISNALQQLDR